MQHCYFRVQWPKQYYSAVRAVRCRMQTPYCPGPGLKHWEIPLNNILHLYYLCSTFDKAEGERGLKSQNEFDLCVCVCVKYLVHISTEETIILMKVVCNCTQVTEDERLYISWTQYSFLPSPFIFILHYHLFHLRSVSFMNIGAYF